MPEGEASWNGPAVNEVEIELAVSLLADALLSDPEFIKRVAMKVRNRLTKDARSVGNVFGPWAGS
jgi:hypothetical protein